MLATVSELPRKRLYENGQIEVFDPESLVCKFRRTSAKPAGKANMSTATRVWAMAGGELA